ncbi:type VI secretion system baseplate subunit TssE [Massilia sp. DWR3-1-1]|uniref:type VI secretion system baseplate subunit TssE n=1 Tax=Massilia sp. DWR3-1-1 TaxID=2804559 RepID=UPI003CEF1C1E
MRSFSPGLFDRLGDDNGSAPAPAPAPTNRQRARSQALEAGKQSITRDLVALLNTRCAMQADALQSYPAVAGSVVNYGLIDFAGMCMTSDTDQQKICRAVQQAIERHEPRLHKVSVDLRPKKGSINRVEFVITAELKGSLQGEALSFDAVFRPSLQQYSINDAT